MPQHQPVLTYLIGEPGSGKSTLAGHLFRGIRSANRDKPFSHRLTTNGVYALGHTANPEYPGTDTLSMSVQPVVIDWLERTLPFFVFGEGDRLGTTSFFAEAERIGYNVNVWMLEGADVAALQRRIRGSNQDPTWLAGRQSKVRNIAEAREVHRLPAGSALPFLESLMADDPLVRQLRGKR